MIPILIAFRLSVSIMHLRSHRESFPGSLGIQGWELRSGLIGMTFPPLGGAQLGTGLGQARKNLSHSHENSCVPTQAFHPGRGVKPEAPEGLGSSLGRHITLLALPRCHSVPDIR